MSRRHAAPFRVVGAETETVTIVSMQCTYGSEVVGLDRDRFTDWASPIDVRVDCTVGIDMRQLFDDLGFSEPTRVRVALLVRCPKALFVDVLASRDLMVHPGSADEQFPLGGVVSGASICGMLQVELLIVRLEPFEGDGAVVHSTAAGDLLWRFEHRYELEGEGSQFPTEVVRFDEDVELKPHKGAPWALFSGGDLDAQFSSTRWKLYLNAEHPWTRSFEMLRTADPSIAALLRCDVVLALAAAVVEHADALDEDGEEGSLRWTLRCFRDQQCKRLFGTTDPEGLTQRCLDPLIRSTLISEFSRLEGGR